MQLLIARDTTIQENKQHSKYLSKQTKQIKQVAGITRQSSINIVVGTEQCPPEAFVSSTQTLTKGPSQ